MRTLCICAGARVSVGRCVFFSLVEKRPCEQRLVDRAAVCSARLIILSSSSIGVTLIVVDGGRPTTNSTSVELDVEILGVSCRVIRVGYLLVDCGCAGADSP